MRVLLVTGLTHFGRAGVQRETERLIAGLLRYDVAVGFMVDTPIAALPEVAYFHMPFPPPADADRRITAALVEHGAELMHVIGGGVRLLWAANRAARGVPWVVSLHNIPPRESTIPWLQGHNALHYPLRNLLRAPSACLWRRFLRRATFSRAICHSPFIAETARRAGCPDRRLVQIPLGCDAPDPSDPDASAEASAFDADDTPRLISVGGLAHHKGFHDYLHVISRLVRDHPRLRYVLMGDVRDRHYHRTLLRLIHRLGLDHHVRLIRKAGEAQRLATAREADLYIVPSHEEGFCLSYLEGAMLSPRVLGTRCGAIVRIAGDDPAQRVVAPADRTALEQATRELLRTRTSTDALAARRAALRHRYDWQRYVDDHLALYRQVAAAPPAEAARPHLTTPGLLRARGM